MQLDEAKQILKNAGYILEDTSIYSELSNFYRYLKVNAPKTGYDLKIEGDENNIIVKFMDNVAKVTLEQFDEDEDPMLYVEAGYDFKSFYNEHTDYGNAMQFIIKNICPTNEAKEIIDDNGYLVEDTDDWDEADMPAGAGAVGRKQFIKAHNAHDNINDKTWNTGVWAIRISTCPLDDEHVDAVDEQLLGYITADGNVSKKLNDSCYLNNVQCEKLAAHFTEYDGSVFANKKYTKFFKQKFHITDKDMYIIIRTGTIINGKFHYLDLDELDGFTGLDL